MSVVAQPPRAFAGIDEVRSRLAAQDYVCDRRVATVVFLATAIGKPVLVEGPAGVGKTELAKALAGALERKLIRLQCDEGLDESKALYEWESHEPPVLLLDEIDRADEEFEAFLLEFLSDYQVSIPEIGTITAVHPPLVVLTSNRSRELSEATKRRCLHLQLDYPDAEMELEIVRLKAPGVGEDLARDLVQHIQRIRALDLRKAPSIGETLDWAQAIVALGAPSLSRELVEETLSVVIKYVGDASKVRRALAADAGEPAPGGHANSHGHAHPHPH